MKTQKKFLYLAVWLLISLLWPVKNVLADHGLSAAAGEAKLPGVGQEGGAAVATFLGRFAGAALALSGSLFLFLIIYGGILIMTSAGSERQKKGRDIIMWAVIGAVILGSAYAITSLVFSIF